MNPRSLAPAIAVICFLLTAQDYNVPFRPRVAGGLPDCASSTALYCEGLEGAGFENTMDTASGTHDPDDTTALVFQQAQQLKVGASATAVTIRDNDAIADQTGDVWIRFCLRIEAMDNTTDTNIFIGRAGTVNANANVQARLNASNHELRVFCSGAASTRVVLGAAGTNATVVYRYDIVNDDIYLWVNKTPNEAADASATTCGDTTNLDGWQIAADGDSNDVFYYDYIEMYNSDPGSGMTLCPTS